MTSSAPDTAAITIPDAATMAAATVMNAMMNAMTNATVNAMTTIVTVTNADNDLACTV